MQILQSHWWLCCTNAWGSSVFLPLDTDPTLTGNDPKVVAGERPNSTAVDSNECRYLAGLPSVQADPRHCGSTVTTTFRAALVPERTAGSLGSQRSFDADCTACGPQHYLFLAATSRRWRSLYCDYSATQETSYQSCLATPQLMRYALQADLADIHRHQGNRAEIVQPPIFRQTLSVQ